MHENAQTRTVAVDQECTRTFVRLNVLDYERAEHSDQPRRSNSVNLVLRQVEYLTNNGYRLQKDYCSVHISMNRGT